MPNSVKTYVPTTIERHADPRLSGRMYVVSSPQPYPAKTLSYGVMLTLNESISAKKVARAMSVKRYQLRGTKQ